MAPATTSAPTMVMPLMAFEPDMSGVCRVAGTLEMISNPTNEASTNTTIKEMSMVESGSGGAEHGADALVDDGAAVRDDGALEDFLLQIEVERARLGEVVEEERLHGAGVHLAGVKGHRGRKVRRAEEGHVPVPNALVGTREGAVAAVCRREV